MPRAQDIRNANKNVTDWGRWQSGRMPPGAFPLSKPRRRSLRLGSAYTWRLVRFEALGHTFRLLIAINLSKEQYRATLAIEHPRDLAVLASYEFHGTHAGWHLLAACGEIEEVPQGVMRGPWQSRYPGARHRHRKQEFGIADDQQALAAAANFFRLHKTEGTLV